MKTINRGYVKERNSHIFDVVDLDRVEFSILRLGLKARIEKLSKRKKRLLESGQQFGAEMLAREIERTIRTLEKLITE